jgi:hypothetical protein
MYLYNLLFKSCRFAPLCLKKSKDSYQTIEDLITHQFLAFVAQLVRAWV